MSSSKNATERRRSWPPGQAERGRGSERGIAKRPAVRRSRAWKWSGGDVTARGRCAAGRSTERPAEPAELPGRQAFMSMRANGSGPSGALRVCFRSVVAAGTSHPPREARGTPPHSRHTGGRERHLLCTACRLCLAITAARLPALADSLRLFPRLAQDGSMETTERGTARRGTRTRGARGRAQRRDHG